MALDLTVSFADTAPDTDEISDVLTEYYAQIRERLMTVGGPPFSIETAVNDTLADIDAYLPPRGAIVFIRDSSGYLLGCGFLRMLDAERAELKRLFVRDLARGMGLGRKLIATRIEKAREMGARIILADTVRGNSSMLALYDSFGFRETPRYDGNANDPALDPYLVYRRLDLSPESE